MSTLNDRNRTDELDNAIVTLNGNTDNTEIGNVGDRLKVDTDISSISVGLLPWRNKNLCYEDMNAASGGVARGTSISSRTAIYRYDGSGYLFSFMTTLKSYSMNWIHYLKIDDNDLFCASGLSSNDVTTASVYNFKAAIEAPINGIMYYDDVLSYNPRYPVRFDEYVELSVEHTSGNKFQAGLIVIQKDT